MHVRMQAIGFDMDYTLAQYRPESFEVLAYELTVEKLIAEFDYPSVSLPLFSSPLHAGMILLKQLQ